MPTKPRPEKKVIIHKNDASKKVKVPSKEAVVAVPKVVAKPVAVVKPNLNITTLSLAGVKGTDMALPKELFGAEVNDALLGQAMRVYNNNLRGHFSNTKTRGEVEGSTRKIYAQKGTGRARHGAVRAPIFVGGGIALGPKSRKTVMDLPKKMKKAALISALSYKAKAGEIVAVSNLDKATGKTKEMAGLVKKISKKSILIIADGKMDLAQRAMGNLKGVEWVNAGELNAYEVIKHQCLVLTREAVEKLQKKLLSPSPTKTTATKKETK